MSSKYWRRSIGPIKLLPGEEYLEELGWIVLYSYYFTKVTFSEEKYHTKIRKTIVPVLYSKVCHLFSSYFPPFLQVMHVVLEKESNVNS